MLGVPSPGEVEGDAALSRAAPRPLPSRPTMVVGRDAVVADLIHQLELQRFVTVVGPGGIGKTTVALLAAHHWAATHLGAPAFIDLGDVAPDSPESVAEAVCAMLGVVLQGTSALECVLDHLQTGAKRWLYSIPAKGPSMQPRDFAESLVASAPGVRVLATSREALRAEGELVHRIEPSKPRRRRCPTDGEGGADLVLRCSSSCSALPQTTPASNSATRTPRSQPRSVASWAAWPWRLNLRQGASRRLASNKSLISSQPSSP